MATAEPPDAPAPPDVSAGGGSARQEVPLARGEGPASGEPHHESSGAPNLNARSWAWSLLGAILLLALGLRLWGIKQGLPYVYNIDEAGHFVPKAVAMSAHGLNPDYFVNPPALTYVLHLVFVLWFGSGHSLIHEYASHPDRVFLLARVTVALLGTGAVWLLYLLGARLFDRRVGLLAGALEAVAFLPVFYGHLALNDAATLLPLTLSLFGSAGVLRYGRFRDYAIAGLGLGFACASKYTAGIVVVPLAAAAAAHYLDGSRGSGKSVLVGLGTAGVCALAAFLLANPYALLDFQRFHSELAHQSSLSGEAQGKLGAPRQGGLLYYLWSLTWGLGWIPSMAAFAGAMVLWWRNQRVAWLLVPAPLLFLAFMGLQDRYFGRWLLPIFPISCLLAAYLAVLLLQMVAGRVRVARRPEPSVSERGPSLASGGGGGVVVRKKGGPTRARVGTAVAGCSIVVLLLGQGLLYSVHNDLVLARADTRNLTRAWMLAHVRSGSRIVLEPIVLDSWLQEAAGARRWRKYVSLQSLIAPDGTLSPQTAHPVALENYETTLAPSLIGWYERQGYCWVISGSTESGRAFANSAAAPLAVAYYRALAAQARVVYRASPYSGTGKPPGFNFDWSFDYYPLSFHRPGPQVTVYRLAGGRCSGRV